MATVEELLRAGVELLRAAGSETPRLDAELLLARAVGVDRTVVLAHPEAPVTVNKPFLSEYAYCVLPNSTLLLTKVTSAFGTIVVPSPSRKGLSAESIATSGASPLLSETFTKYRANVRPPAE